VYGGGVRFPGTVPRGGNKLQWVVRDDQVVVGKT
jgi:hypothetical protein